jgi:hypothetical protein
MEKLYGVRSGATDPVAAAVGEVLGHALQKRESSFYGDYWIARFDNVEVLVIEQIDPVGEPQEEEFMDYEILVYVGSSAPIDDISGLMTESGVIEPLR